MLVCLGIFMLQQLFLPKFTFEMKPLIATIKHAEISHLWPLKTSLRSKKDHCTTHCWLQVFWIRMISVCWTKSWCLAVLKICLLLAVKSLNILAAVHSVLICIKHKLIMALLCSLFCLYWTYWFWLMLAFHVRFNLPFLVEHAILILNRNLLASKAVKNDTIVLAIIIFDEWNLCYLALSVYFIEIIVSIMFHKKKVAYEWEPCLRENVHTQ